MLFFPRAVHTAERVADATDDGAVLAHLLLSHLSMFAASVYALRRPAVRLGVFGLLATAVSVAYHACRAEFACVGGLALDEWRKADHTTALTFFGALALHLLATTTTAADAAARHLEDAAGYALPLVVMLAVRAYPFELQGVVLMLLFVLAVAAYRFLRGGHAFRPPPAGTYRGRFLAAGLAVGALAGVCFYVEDSAPLNDSPLDGHVHALWHWLAGLSIWALAAAVAPERREKV